MLDTLKEVIELADSNILKQVPESRQAFLKDLSASHQNSNFYDKIIVGTCDDLLEQVDKKIDTITKHRADGEITNEQVVTQGGRGMMKTENTMRKPQHAWIQSIDNSYNPFVPLVSIKHHSATTNEVHPRIKEAQKEKVDDPAKFKLFEYGSYKQQDKQEGL